MLIVDGGMASNEDTRSKDRSAMKAETARSAHLAKTRKLEARAIVAAVILMTKSEPTFCASFRSCLPSSRTVACSDTYT